VIASSGKSLKYDTQTGVKVPKFSPFKMYQRVNL